MTNPVNGPDYRKLTINVHNDVHAELATMQVKMRAGTITEVIKRSIALMKFVLDHPDGQLLIREDDETREIVLL